MANGSYGEAASFFRRSVLVDPGSLAARFNLACALQKIGDLPGAIAVFRRCAADYPDHIDSAYNLGCALEQIGNWPSAIEGFKACLSRDPMHRDSAFNLAACLHRMGDVVEAIDAYRACCERHPGDQPAIFNLACLLQYSGDLVGAILAYRASLDLVPLHRESAFNLAVCLHRQGEIPAAIAAYRDCIAMHSDHPDAACNLGFILQQGGAIEGAIALYRETLARCPDHWESAFNLASCLQRRGDSDAAVAAYSVCMARHPGRLEAGLNLGNLLVALGRTKEAIAILDALRAHFPQAADLVQNLAIAKWCDRLAMARPSGISQLHHRILVACMPKSASTFLADVLARLPGMQRVHLVPDYGRREHELDLEQLINHADLSYVSQLHLRPSRLTMELLQACAVRPVFLFRNIWDVMASLRDHMHTHSMDWSMARIDPAFRSWEAARQYEFLARAMMPWFIDFYVGWSRQPGKLALSYEELMEAPAAAVGGIAEWAGIEVNAAEIEQALAATGHSATFNRGGSGRGKAVPAGARAHVEALAAFYPDIDFIPLMGAGTPAA